MGRTKSVINAFVSWFVDRVGSILLVTLLLSGIVVWIGIMEVLRDLFSYYSDIYQHALTVFGVTLIVGVVLAVLGGFREKTDAS